MDSAIAYHDLVSKHPDLIVSQPPITRDREFVISLLKEIYSDAPDCNLSMFDAVMASLFWKSNYKPPHLSNLAPPIDLTATVGPAASVDVDMSQGNSHGDASSATQPAQPAMLLLHLLALLLPRLLSLHCLTPMGLHMLYLTFT